MIAKRGGSKKRSSNVDEAVARAMTARVGLLVALDSLEATEGQTAAPLAQIRSFAGHTSNAAAPAARVADDTAKVLSPRPARDDQSGKKPAAKTANAQAAVQFLRRTFAANPEISSRLTDEVVKGAATQPIVAGMRTEDLNYVGGMVDDIYGGVLAAAQRVLDFWHDLVQVEVAMAEEEVRHTQSMAAIGKNEVLRWSQLSQLSEDYATVFSQAAAGPNAIDNPEKFPLFSDRGANQSASTNYSNGFASRTSGRFLTAPATQPLDPPVSVDDRVFASIRSLTDAARTWQIGTAADDPEGYRTAVANERLYQAVRTAQGYLLMISHNRHMSGENRLRLVTELSRHEQQLASFDGQITEAGFRLTLGDLKAFYGTGITEKDIQAIGTAALFYIGYGANQ
jgi:hypothetical protein